MLVADEDGDAVVDEREFRGHDVHVRAAPPDAAGACSSSSRRSSSSSPASACGWRPPRRPRRRPARLTRARCVPRPRPRRSLVAATAAALRASAEPAATCARAPPGATHRAPRPGVRARDGRDADSCVRPASWPHPGDEGGPLGDRADRPGAAPRRRSRGEPSLDLSRAVSARRRARAARARLPSRSSRATGGCTSTTPIAAGDTARGRVPLRRGGRPPAARAAARRPARGEPQRRRAALRDRRPALRSAWVTAAARSTRTDNAQDPESAAGQAARRRRRRGGPPRWQTRAHRPAQPVADLVGPGAQRAVDRRCRPGPRRRSTGSPSSPTSRRRTSAGRAYEGDLRLAPDRLAAGAELGSARRRLLPRRRLLGDRGPRLPRARLPALRQRYVYGDFCTGACGRCDPSRAWRSPTSAASGVRIPQLTSIGTDARGELVFTTGSGELLRAVPAR